MINIEYTRFPELNWKAKEVVKDKIEDRPHLLVRLEISQAYFPHRAAEPFVRIMLGEKAYLTSWFAEVSADNTQMIGYFPVDLPEYGTIEFGYGDKVIGRIPRRFESAAVERLDRKRLPRDLVEVTLDYLKTTTRREERKKR